MKKETCYEYFACKKHDCAMYDCDDKNCWEVDGTCCNNLVVEYVSRQEQKVCP